MHPLRSAVPVVQSVLAPRVLGMLSLAICSFFAQEIRSSELPPLSPLTADGFAVPHPNPQFAFPRDHGRHSRFKLEWWYITGHLYADQGSRFGFQATIFRRAGRLPNEDKNASPPAAFSSEEIYLSHVAVLNAASCEFLHSEKLARSGWNAFSRDDTLDARVQDNRIEMIDPLPSKIRLSASIRDQARMLLDLTPEKPLVVFGKEGVSRKGDSDTAASWYLTFPRLKASGTLRLKNHEWKVQGSAWMDHEISSSQLTENQAGWDWAGIQLEDGREIMTYRLRRKDGSTDPVSALVWVSKDGTLTHQSAADFQWETSKTWKSPRSGAAYPLPVRLHTIDPASGKPVVLELEPLCLDQELESPLSGVPYWEGACRVKKGTSILGSAYVELTGYSGGLGRALDARKPAPRER
jgi:predicted secreted hydrolase